MRRKPGFIEGKSNLTVIMRAELADALAKKAAEDRRNQSATVDLMVESYLSNKKLQALPEGMKAHRSMVGGGETKLRRYKIEPRTVRLLQEAESIGYSQSYIVEEAIREGVTTMEATDATR